MCLIVFSWQQSHDYPLIVTANRDEFYQRPTAPLAPWKDSPVIAGQDLQAGGTWMGVTADGRFAAVTNFRQGSEMHREYPISRGRLCQHFLEGTLSVTDYLQQLAADAMDCGGFNLLVSDGRTLGYACNRFGAESGSPYYDYNPTLKPGLYSLSNHRLDSPWPKADQSRQRMQAMLESRLLSREPGKIGLLNEADFLPVITHQQAVPDHHLPDTGIGLEKERFLSPAFISDSLDYGTRASTILLRTADGRQSLMEQTWLPGGQTGIRTYLCLI